MREDIKYQLRPHFLFNELSVIRYYTKKDPDAAYDMVYDFSEYLRGNIESMVDDGLISWSRELEHIRACMRLEQRALKDRLKVVYEIEGNMQADADCDRQDGIQVPARSIILLAENAVRHSICSRQEGGTLWIRSQETSDGCIIEIEDNGVGYETEGCLDEIHSVLAYLNSRLELLPEAKLTLESKPNQGNLVRVWIRRGIN